MGVVLHCFYSCSNISIDGLPNGKGYSIGLVVICDNIPIKNSYIENSLPELLLKYLFLHEIV